MTVYQRRKQERKYNQKIKNLESTSYKIKLVENGRFEPIRQFWITQDRMLPSLDFVSPLTPGFHGIRCHVNSWRGSMEPTSVTPSMTQFFGAELDEKNIWRQCCELIVWKTGLTKSVNIISKFTAFLLALWACPSTGRIRCGYLLVLTKVATLLPQHKRYDVLMAQRTAN